jgi:hypothetical protein
MVPPARPDSTSAQALAEPGCSGLLNQLLARVDENLWCRPLLDNPLLGMDVSSPLLFQLQPAIDINRRLSELEELDGAEGIASLSGCLNDLFARLVSVLAFQPLDAAGRSTVPPRFVEILQETAELLATLADLPADLRKTEAADVMNRVARSIAALPSFTSGPDGLPAASPLHSTGPSTTGD